MKKMLLVFCCAIGLLHAQGSVADKLTLITSTSPIPSNPSTSMLERTQASLNTVPGFKDCHKIIVFDGVPHWKKAAIPAYEQYKKNVIKLTKTHLDFQNTRLVFCKNHKHLTNALREGMALIKTPFVFVHQHDFEIVRPIDVEGIIRSMESNPNLKHIRLSRKRNIHTPWDGPIDEVIDGPHFVPLCRTWGWSDNDHFTRLDYYRNFVFPRIGNRKVPMEFVLHRSERKSTWKNKANHKRFGTYLYGAKGPKNGRYIRHLNGKKWNK